MSTGPAALAVLVAVSAPPAAAAGSPWSLRIEGGFVALENGSTTRVPAPALGVAVRYALGDHLAVDAGWRGALRASGNDLARVLVTVHDLAVGGSATWAGDLGRAGIGVHVVPQVEVARLGGRGVSSFTSTTASVGAGADLELGLRVGAASWATLVVGATTRRSYVDLAMLCGLEWRL